MAFLKGLEGLPIDKISLIEAHTFGGKVSQNGDKKFRKVGRKYVPCTFLWYSLSIKWDGTVVPCCVDLAGDMPLGDVRKESLLKIWNGQRLIQLREKIASGKYRDIALCGGCDILWKEQVFGVPLKSLKELRYFLPGW